MAHSAGKTVYTVESYVPRDKTPREQYDDLDEEVMLRRMRLQVLMDLYDEETDCATHLEVLSELSDKAHAALVKAIAKMDKLAKHHPELIDPLD